MTLTNLEILNIVAFSNDGSSFVNDTAVKLPIRFVWCWRKNIKKVRELADSIRELNSEIITSYSDEEHSYVDENGDQRIKAEYVEEYISKINELNAQENEVEIATVNINDIGEIKLSVPELNAISFMITE